MKRLEKAVKIHSILDELYPAPPIPLDHKDPYTLLVSVLLSAQTTDKRVNMVTPELFRRAPTPRKMVKLEGDEILCIYHGARFDCKTGKNLCIPATRPVKSFPVEVRAGQIYVDVS